MQRIAIGIALCTLGVACAIAPASAAMPSIAAYFSGTWSCTTKYGALVVKVYGSNPAGTVMMLYNDFDTSAGYASSVSETYSQSGDITTVVASPPAPEITCVGTSTGFANDRLVFNGSGYAPAGPRPERMTYTRTGKDHFTRAFSSITTPEGPYQDISSESCTRLSPAPVPTGPQPSDS